MVITYWELFSTLVTATEAWALQELEDAERFEDLDSVADILTAFVTKAAKGSIPRLWITLRSKPWWNPNLKALRKGLNTALRQYKKSRSEELEEA